MTDNPNPYKKSPQKNVLGEPLQPCCFAPMTGYFRDGFCHLDQSDYGLHTVCAQVTDAFLEFSKAKGNDLSTPRPEFGFPGLKAGDRWCLCLLRWKEAYDAGCAPSILVASCHESVLEVVPLSILKDFAVKPTH